MNTIMTGKYHHTLDQKSRVSIPSPLRKKLGDAFHITISQDDFLVGYTEEGWVKFNRLLDMLPEDEAAFFRGNSADCTIDAQGRAFIPQDLREFAGLGTNVVIRGNGDTIQIWKEETFEERHAEMATRDRIADIKSKLQAIKERESE
ncbi:MAG: hypothetical protein GX823_01580 [Clostridiales bacterium]|nr:hypothetical protein [Clostridiales bacterium]